MSEEQEQLPPSSNPPNEINNNNDGDDNTEQQLGEEQAAAPREDTDNAADHHHQEEETKQQTETQEDTAAAAIEQASSTTADTCTADTCTADKDTKKPNAGPTRRRRHAGGKGGTPVEAPPTLLRPVPTATRAARVKAGLIEARGNNGDDALQNETNGNNNAPSNNSARQSATQPGAVAAQGRAFGLRRVLRRLSTSFNFRRNNSGDPDLNTDDERLPRAILVDDHNVELIEEQEYAMAIPVAPCHRQKRFWLGLLIGSGAIVGLILFLFFTLGGDQSAQTTQTQAAALSSAAPSSSLNPTMSPSYSPTSTMDVQRKALIDFYNLANGPAWIENNGWSNSADYADDSSVCNWYGVSCDYNNNHVTDLSLPANNITGDLAEIMGAIMRIESIQEVDLDSNDIQGNLTEVSNEISTLLNSSGLELELEFLDLRLNNITGSVSAELCSIWNNKQEDEEGIFRVDCHVACECCEHETLCECHDVDNWKDSHGNECDWYDGYALKINRLDDEKSVAKSTLCDGYGDKLEYENEGHTASTACCICGGGNGIKFNPSPSIAPTYAPSNQPALSSLPTDSAAPTNDEVIALEAIFYALNGTEWTNSENWLSGESFCFWHGVHCNENDRVIILSLPENNLAGSLPSDTISTLQHLRALTLSGNNITGTIPDDLWSLKELVSLKLAKNFLSGTISSQISSCHNLKALDLGYNLLNNSIPSEIGELSELKNQLALNNNYLSSSIPSEISLLKHLQYLDLSHNDLTGPLPMSDKDAFEDMQFLSLGYNFLEGELPEDIWELENLWYLSLSKNNFTGTISQRVGNMNSLLYLLLDSNSFTKSIPAAIKSLNGLYFLSLGLNSFDGSVPKDICVIRETVGGFLEHLWADCDDNECACCTACCNRTNQICKEE